METEVSVTVTEDTEVIEDDSQEAQVLEEVNQESQDLEEVNQEECQDLGEVHEVQEVFEESYGAVGLVSPNPSSNASISLANLNSGAKGKYYKQTYRPAWEQMPDFRGWLRGVVGQSTRAYCVYCQKTLHAHRLSLLKHTCTIRHQKAAQIHNTRKNRRPGMEQMRLVLQQDSMSEIDPDESEAIEYSEVMTDPEDEEASKQDAMQESVDDTEEDEEGSLDIQQTTFNKHTPQNYPASNPLKPPIWTNVIDTVKGVPVFGLQVSLYKLIDGRWTYINEGTTNSTGKFAHFVERRDFSTGRYKLHYDVDRYFESRKMDTMYPFIEVVFDCHSTTDSYHVPVLLSPFGYSTYRGA